MFADWGTAVHGRNLGYKTNIGAECPSSLGAVVTSVSLQCSKLRGVISKMTNSPLVALIWQLPVVNMTEMRRSPVQSWQGASFFAVFLPIDFHTLMTMVPNLKFSIRTLPSPAHA